MNVYDILEEYLNQGKNGVLATIVKKRGATPQVAGAKIFIDDDGKIFGTVGGGCVEAEVWQEARKTLKTKEAAIVHYALNSKEVENDDMICGGNIDVFLEPVFEKYRDLYRNISYFQKKGKRAVNITHFGEAVFSKTLLTVNGDVIGDGAGEQEEVDEAVFYTKAPKIMDGKIIEPVLITSTLYIYGAGHISQFISKAAKTVDFNVMVMDDRVQFANRERFPDADEVIADEFENVLKYGSADVEVYSVIVTRGHKHDALVLGEVLKRKKRYVGMIGSKRKINMVFDYLQRKGFDKALLKTVHAPIGLDINSETPQEIALSIVAELVKARGEKRG
jgi:xanthine dehydrogenase accessory factor